VPEWWNIWSNGLPDESRSPKSDHRMAAEGIPFPWRWNGSMISTDLDVIWRMSDQGFNVGINVGAAAGHRTTMAALRSAGKLR